MNPVVLDSDAVLIFRERGLLDHLLAALRQAASSPAFLGNYRARAELGSISRELEIYVQRGWIRIESVPTKGHPGSDLLRELRLANVDKGEREAIAWAATQTAVPDPIFVSNDSEARRHADAQGLTAYDPFDLLVVLVGEKGLPESVVREACSPWDDPSRQFGRPKDFTTFNETFKRRRGRLDG